MVTPSLAVPTTVMVFDPTDSGIAAEAVPDFVEGGVFDASGFDSGREWDREGAGGAVDPLQRAECGETVCAGGLWIAGADAD